MCSRFRIKGGDSAKVTIDSYPDRMFSAGILTIGNAPDPDNGNYEIELCIQKNECKFFNGLINYFRYKFYRFSNSPE